jgi:hypothetical protein
MVHTCGPNNSGGKGLWSKTSLGKVTQDLKLKTKWPGGVAQVVEWLPIKN